MIKRVFLGIASIVALVWVFGLLLTLFPPSAGTPTSEVTLSENYRLSTLTFDDSGSFIFDDEDIEAGLTRPSAFRCLIADMELALRKQTFDSYLDNGLPETYLKEYGLCGSGTESQRTDVIKELSDPERFAHIVSIVYIHGWKGNGTPEDVNHIKFKEIVKKLAATLNAGSRNIKNNPEVLVNGIYLGWQGARTAVTALEPLFFFKSKKIADEVSRGHMNLVLQSIDRFYREVNDSGRSSNDINHNFITIGHSFGGRILFNMTSDILYSRVLSQASDLSWSEKVSGRDFGERSAFNNHIIGDEAGDNSSLTQSAIVRGFGDLTVLLNPAFEASRYVLLNDLDDRINFNDSQLPILYTISSAKDQATHFLFPLTRWYETSFSNRSHVFSSDRSQLLDTAGNHEDFRTHWLRYGDGAWADNDYGTTVLAKPNADVQNLIECEHGTAWLKPLDGQQTDTPFVIAYDKEGLMMEDHNDIFNDCVSAHLTQVIYNEIVANSYSN